MKRIISLFVAAFMLVSCMGSMAFADAAMTPGTYTATARGFEGYVTVEVEVSENAIVNVAVTEITDVPDVITEIPVATLPGLIVANQTVNVDNVTGATFTSTAIKTAVKDCLKQAGAVDAFNERVATTVPAYDTVDTEVDVLVIGGGNAGCMAALAAYSEEFNAKSNGLSVMLAEKQAFLGGSITFAGGVVNVYNDQLSETWLDEAMVMELNTIQAYNNCPVNESLLRNVLSITADTYRHFQEMGAETSIFFGNPETDLFYRFLFEPKAPGNGYDHWGQNYTRFMQKKLAETDVDVRLNTRATSLITDESGAVVGAMMEHAGNTYAVKAKKVILASGGFPHNRDLIAQYTPDYVGAVPFAAGSNTGDGFIMATELGAATVGHSLAGYVGSDFRMGIWENYATYHTGNSPALHINVDGQRYNDESTHTNVEFLHVIQQPKHKAWGIVDSNNPDVASIATSGSENVFQADTLEELAAAIGVPIDTFLATVETYNAAVAAGEDTEFGTPVASMDAVDAAPFYAFGIQPVALTSMVALDVTDNCEVLKENGEVIENLYAAGDLVIGHFIEFYVGGRGYNTGLYTGRLCGEGAKAAILGE